MSGNVNFIVPQRINVESCIITDFSGNKQMDLYPLLREFSYYSSIWNPFASFEMILQDGGSLVSTLPIIGEEKIEIKWRSDYTGYSTIHLKLRLVSVEKLLIQRQRTEVLVVRAVSDESVRDAKIRLRRSFTDMPVSDMIQKIVDGKSDSDEFRLNSKDWSNRKLITKTETEGNRDIVIPNMSPSQATAMLCRMSKAKETKDHASLFLFYEDQFGFHFTTPYQQIENKSVKDLYIFTDKNTGDKSMLGSQTSGTRGRVSGNSTTKPFEQVKINSFHIDSLFDFESSLVNGMLSNQLTTLDPQNSIVKEYKHNYFDDFDKFPKTTGALGYKKITNKFIYHTNSGDTSTRVMQTNASHTGAYTGNFMNHDEKIPAMVGLYAMLRDIVVTVTIPGDSDRAPGDKIRITVPEFGSTEDAKQQKHRLLHGEWYVTSVRHIYNVTEDGYQTVMQLCKTCYEASVETERV